MIFLLLATSVLSNLKIVFHDTSLKIEHNIFPISQLAFLGNKNKNDPKLFVKGSPEMPPTHPSLPVRKSDLIFQREPILISRLSGQQELRLKLKQNEAVSGRKMKMKTEPIHPPVLQLLNLMCLCLYLLILVTTRSWEK